MQHFTERFKARFVEMALSEPDLNVRKVALSVLQLVYKHDMLEDSQRADVAKLIFHVDGKIRAAAAPYFAQLVEDEVNTQVESGASGGDKDEGWLRSRLWFKCLALLMVEYARALSMNEESPEDPAESQDSTQGSSQRLHEDTNAVSRGVNYGRASLVLDALWEENDSIREWSILADYLLLDHSENGEQSQLPSASEDSAESSSAPTRKKKGLGEHELGYGHRLTDV